MKYDLKNMDSRLLRGKAAPVGLILLGAILVISPNTASALVGKVLGWILVLLGAFIGFWAAGTKTGLRAKVPMCLALVIIGSWMLRRPLMLASLLGTLAGILLLVTGIQNLSDPMYIARGKTRSLLIIAAGVLLMASPMIASQLLLRACGVVCVLIGIAMLSDRRNGGNPKKPDIIDAL